MGDVLLTDLLTPSSHRVEVITIDNIEPHPNAERLDIVTVYGYTTCVAKGTFSEGDVAAFIPPDSIVPDTEQFSFLEGHLRIKARKLRGVVSYGFLAEAPAGAEVGDDVAELMGIEHYYPKEPTDDTSVPGPPGLHPVYDLESLLRYPDAFETGEPVWVTEKIHGTNCRITCVDGQVYVGSHRTWKKEQDSSLYWRAVKKTENLLDLARSFDGWTFYGEIFGPVQELQYGGELRFALFDILDRSGLWLDPMMGRQIVEMTHPVPWVPLLETALPYDLATLKALSDGKSTVPGAKNIREGIVVRPLSERYDSRFGRVALKLVSAAYLEKAS